MELMGLKIELVRWGERKGSYEGEATFAGEKGTVTLVLDERRCRMLFDVCADGIVETAKSAARDLTSACIEHAEKPALAAN
jgi:hypothetical protein